MIKITKTYIQKKASGSSKYMYYYAKAEKDLDAVYVNKSMIIKIKRCEMNVSRESYETKPMTAVTVLGISGRGINGVDADVIYTDMKPEQILALKDVE